jgi:membrane-associated phospholipid phosphatase
MTYFKMSLKQSSINKTSVTIICLLFTVLLNSQEHVHPDKSHREKMVQDMGDYAQHAPALASLALILIKKDKKGFWQFSKSYGTNLALTYLLKTVINKDRPDGRTDGHAFPSGHTSVAFQGASFLQKRYGWTYGIPAYVVATFVGYSRIEGIHHRHDAWDVLGGALVGIGSTYLFTTPYAKEHFELSYRSSQGNYLVGLKYKF